MTGEKRRGRPRLGADKLTAAECSRRYREKRRREAAKGRIAAVDERTAEHVSTMALIDTLRLCITQGDKANGLNVLRLIGQRIIAMDDLPEPAED